MNGSGVDPVYKGAAKISAVMLEPFKKSSPTKEKTVPKSTTVAPKPLTDIEVIIHTALQKAVDQGDARLVLATLLTESASLARAILKSKKLEAHQVASLWGGTLSEALEPYEAPAGQTTKN